MKSQTSIKSRHEEAALAEFRELSMVFGLSGPESDLIPWSGDQPAFEPRGAEPDPLLEAEFYVGYNLLPSALEILEAGLYTHPFHAARIREMQTMILTKMQPPKTLS